ncbi:MAG: hypothetical protein ACKO2P_13685 [Planctomycetota bacterium]
MALSTDRVEEIVRQVLQQLQAGRTAPSAAAAAAAAPALRSASSVPVVAPVTTSVPVPASGDAVLRIADRAVTEAVLQAAGAAGRTVSLVRGAVLTPSGRDFVRRHNVRLSSFVAGMTTAAATAAGAAVAVTPGILIVCGRETTARSAATALNWTIREVVDEFTAARTAQEVLPGRRVVCVGCEPAMAACVLNRNASVRAAVLERAHGMERLLERMQPHAVCLQSSGWSLLQLTRLLERLQRPVRQPAGWVEVQSGAVS